MTQIAEFDELSGVDLSAEEQAILSSPEEVPTEPAADDAGGVGGSDPASAPVGPDDTLSLLENPLELTADMAAKPEQKQDPAPADSQTVPLATLLEERKSSGAKMEAKIAEMQSSYEQRIEALVKQLAPQPEEKPEAEPDPMPDSVVDPEGFNQWLGKRETAAREAAEAKYEAFAEKHTVNMAMMQETVFAASKPDYHEAFNHLRNARAAEMKLMSPGMTDQQLIDAVKGECMALAKAAVGQGRNAAETFYNLATSRGWKAPEAKTDEKPDVADKTTGAVDQINAASAASAAIGSAPGATANKLTAAVIAAMTEEEIANLEDGVFEKAMGA